MGSCPTVGSANSETYICIERQHWWLQSNIQDVNTYLICSVSVIIVYSVWYQFTLQKTTQLEKYMKQLLKVMEELG